MLTIGVEIKLRCDHEDNGNEGDKETEEETDFASVVH